MYWKIKVTFWFLSYFEIYEFTIHIDNNKLVAERSECHYSIDEWLN